MKRHVWWLKFRRITIIIRTTPSIIRAKVSRDDEAFYTQICNMLLQLGGIYIKFLQGVLLQSEAMKKWRSADRWTVFEAIQPDLIDVHRVLQKEFRGRTNQLFSSVEAHPFAAGSFGQVYRAKLLSGQTVVIKVLRPYVREVLKFDLKILSVLARLMSSNFTSLEVDFRSAVKEFKRATLRETDYIGEVAFAQEMYEYFKDDPLIVIPKTYKDLSTRKIITQDFIEGVSVAEVIRAQQESGHDPADFVVQRTNGSDLRKLLSHLGVQVLHGFFAAERMPGDIHPGNVRIMAGDKIGLIDFGISARRPQYPHIFYRLLKQLTHVKDDGSSAGDMFVTYLEYFAHDLYRAMQRLSSFAGEEVDLVQDVRRYAQQVFDKKTKQAFKVEHIKHSTMFGAHVNRVVNEGNRFCLTTRVDFVDLLRAVQSLVAMIDTLEYRGLIKGIFDQVYQRVTAEYPQFTVEPPNRLSVNAATDIISRWLEKLALRNFELFMIIRREMKQTTSKTKELVEIN